MLYGFTIFSSSRRLPDGRTCELPVIARWPVRGSARPGSGEWRGPGDTGTDLRKNRTKQRQWPGDQDPSQQLQNQVPTSNHTSRTWTWSRSVHGRICRRLRFGSTQAQCRRAAGWAIDRSKPRPTSLMQSPSPNPTSRCMARRESGSGGKSALPHPFASCASTWRCIPCGRVPCT